MTTLLIPDMSCNHCRAAVTEALTALDPAAQVQVDLAARTATVQGSAAPQAMIAALQAVGFPATVAG